MMAAPVSTASGFSPGTPRPLFPVSGYATTPGNRGYDVSPDDQRFIMLRTLTDTVARQPMQLVLVDNWLDEFKAKMKRR
jgi:hypothetical protein